jgi:hypothetical protein
VWKFSEAKRNKRFRKISTKQGGSKGDFLLFCFGRLLYITASCSLPKKVFLPFPQGRKSKLFFIRGTEVMLLSQFMYTSKQMVILSVLL